MNTADKGIRVGNYLIDTACFTIIFLIQSLILENFPQIVPDEGSPFSGIYFIIFYFSYYFLFEYFFSKTPGKFLTKTIVINSYGQKASAKLIFIRSICRIIPIDNFSFLFGSGLHDTISHTQVVLSSSALKKNID
jgi:uncharacterized RDD family membrane protein YckC